MAEVGVVEAATVIVDGGSAENNFVSAIVIHVSNAQAVCALAAISLVLVGVGGKGPACGQLTVAPIQRADHGFCVIAARENHARPLAVEIGHTGEEAVDAVAVGIAPIADVAACVGIINGLHNATGLAVKYGEIFRPRQNISRAVAVIRIAIADHSAAGVPSAVSGFHHHFRFAIAVKVVNQKLCVMRAGADIAAQVDTPQMLTVEFVRVD